MNLPKWIQREIRAWTAQNMNARLSYRREQAGMKRCGHCGYVSPQFETHKCRGEAA